jgi:hypothetical protein
VHTPPEGTVMKTQDIAEQLSLGVGRSVIIIDNDDGIAGVSFRSEDLSPLQRDTHASATAVVQDWLRAPRSQRASGAVLLSDVGPAWVTYPLSDEGERAGWALVRWLPEENDRIELGLLDVAAGLMGAGRNGRARRRTVMRDLLDPDPAVRRESLRRARSQRWLDRRGAWEVRAVMFDESLNLLRRLRAGQELCRTLPGAAELLREREDAVFVLTNSPECGGDLDKTIRSWAARRGIPLRAVGSASVRTEDEDLARAAHAAHTAAELSVSVPELIDATSGDGLGGWLLLNAVPGQRALLALASPAAELLCALGASQRETVEVYLDEAGQVRAACERLHIHRTTLYYRLDNLPEVVKVALAHGMQRSTLHLALKLDRLWSAAGV